MFKELYNDKDYYPCELCQKEYLYDTGDQIFI